MSKWKICCAVSAVLIIIIVVVLVTLSFTLFKPKDPKIIPQSVTLESFRLQVSPTPSIKGDLSLGLIVMIDNPNYGGFKYTNSTAYINYRGNLVGEALIGSDLIKARSKHNVSTSVTIFADKLVTDPDIVGDFFAGVLNFTSSTILHGKVNVFNIFKLKATSNTSCNISISVVNKTADSVCTSKIRL